MWLVVVLVTSPIDVFNEFLGDVSDTEKLLSPFPILPIGVAPLAGLRIFNQCANE
jgi:hypothetical protein